MPKKGEKRGNYNRHSTTRTSVYLIGSRAFLLQTEERARGLRSAGYAVVSDWHNSDDIANGRFVPIQMEFAKLAATDVCILDANDSHHRVYLLNGFAQACGIRVVAIGDLKHLDKDVRGLFAINVQTWEELAANEFLILGSARWKKEKLEV